MTTFDEIMAQAKLPEDSVGLCLRRDLTGRFRELERRLGTANTEKASLGERSEASVIAEEMEALRKEMAANEATFRLRAMPATEWNAFDASKPTRTKDETPADFLSKKFYPWVVQMVARCCIDPVMTTDQVDQLVQVLSGGDWDALSNATYKLNDQREGIPFSVAAYAATQNSGDA